jgi:Legionella pneumophila major outer membrane protein precursor
MPRILRWSRCAFAILLAVQAYSSTSLAQERWVGNANSATTPPVPTARTPEREAPAHVQVASATTSDKAIQAAWISDNGSDCSPYGDVGSNCCGGDCGIGCGEGCTPSCDSGSCNCSANCGPRCCFFADYLYLQVTDADVTHAQQQNGTGGAGTVPFGEIGTIDAKYDSGIRVGGVISCGPCSSVLVSYSFFETDNDETLNEPIIPGGGGAVGSLVHHPGTALTASVGPVSASYDVQFQVGDALFRHECLRGSCYSVNFLLGAQVGHLEQDFSQSGVFSGGNQGAINTNTSINFDGGGLKAGFDVERQLFGRISLYGRATAAAMQGEFRGRYSMTNTSTTALLADAEWTDSRIVPQLEYEAGLNWQSCNGRWHMSAGYMMSQWQNTVTTQEFIDAVQRDRYVNVGDTISFAGLVARVGCCW